MESVALTETKAQPSASSGCYSRKIKLSFNAVIIERSFNAGGEGRGVGINSLSKGLVISANQIVDKLNEMLKAKLPGGLQSLKKEDVTPETTADHIVSSITALYDAYAKQHPEMSPDELISSFMDKARRGVDKGYRDAFKTLDTLGAFNFDGVQEGIEKTKALIDQKLSAFETAKRKELGLEITPDRSAQEGVSTPLLEQAGKQISVMA